MVALAPRLVIQLREDNNLVGAFVAFFDSAFDSAVAYQHESRRHWQHLAWIVMDGQPQLQHLLNDCNDHDNERHPNPMLYRHHGDVRGSQD